MTLEGKIEKVPGIRCGVRNLAEEAERKSQSF
jgi:hypothetical protein